MKRTCRWNILKQGGTKKNELKRSENTQSENVVQNGTLVA